MTELPTHVDIRDVSLRDGLQIEDPIPLSAKLELLAAVAATGVREMEATAFVSPSKVPALADAAELAAELHQLRPASSSPRWWPVPTAPSGRSPRAWDRSSTWCRRPTATATPTSAGPLRRPPRRSPRSSRSPTTAASSVEVIVATAWDCPFDGPTPPQRVVDIVTAATDRGCRPARDRRHHRHHHPATGHGADRTGPPADRRHPARRALPQHPRRRAGQRLRGGRARVSPGWTPRSAGSAAARSRRVPAATSPPRTWCTCCATAEFTSTSTCRPRSPRPGSRRTSSATTCRVRCCAPATGSWIERTCQPELGTLSAKGRQTRQAIEQAARKLFAERGFHGTTLADITSAAGKSPAVFYRYFADKEDLLAALAESFLHDVVTPSGLSLHLPDSPRRRRLLHLRGDRLLEHVQAEHRHHDRGRPTGRDSAAIRRRAERVPPVRHGHRRRIGAPRPGAGIRRPNSIPSTRRRRSRCCSRTSPPSSSAPSGLGVDISDDDAIATLSRIWKKTLYGF